MLDYSFFILRLTIDLFNQNQVDYKIMINNNNKDDNFYLFKN